MRESDPEGYKETKKNIRFKAAAEALETDAGVALARSLGREIDEAFKSDAVFQKKITDLPTELNIQQQRQVAAMHKEVALEGVANQQILLQTAIDRNKTVEGWSPDAKKGWLASWWGGAAEKGWEEALQQGATFGMAEGATQLANQRYIDKLRSRYPQIYQETIGQAGFPAMEPKLFDRSALDLKQTRERLGEFSPELHGVPRQLNEQQSKAIDDSLDRLAEANIKQADGFNRLAEAIENQRPPTLVPPNVDK